MFLSNALIQALRAAFTVSLQTYCGNAHKAVSWDQYLCVSTRVINSFQLVLTASPRRPCSASIKNHQLLLLEHKQ